ncbi:MAG: NifB/NifX family molybdenum-iron cluster-binding protein [Campylobacterota bacterium]
MSSCISVTSKQNIESILKVAFATGNLEDIDAHFGSTKQFAVYDISKESWSLNKVIKLEHKDTDETVGSLRGVDIVYFTDIGPTAAAKIINAKIFPIKYKEVVSIDTELQKLVTMLNTNPPPFIKKIVEKEEAACGT